MAKSFGLDFFGSLQKHEEPLFLFLNSIKIPDLLGQYKQYCLVERGMTAKNYKSIVRVLKNLMEYTGTIEMNNFTEKECLSFMANFLI